VLENLQTYFAGAASLASEELRIVRRAFWPRVTSIENLTLLCSIADEVGGTAPSQHVVSDAFDNGAVRRALRSVFQSPGDVAPALCGFLHLLSPQERGFDRIIREVVACATINPSDGFLRLPILNKCILSLGETSLCATRLKECAVQCISACHSKLSLAQLGQWLNTDSFAAFGSPTARELLNVIVNRPTEALGSLLSFCAEVQATLPEARAEVPAVLQSLVRSRFSKHSISFQLRTELRNFLRIMSLVQHNGSFANMLCDHGEVLAQALLLNVAPTRLFCAGDTLDARCNCFGQFRSAVELIDPDSAILGAAIDLIVEAILPVAVVEADGGTVAARIVMDGPNTPAQDALRHIGGSSLL
jgi:hypothetical protein